MFGKKIKTKFNLLKGEIELLKLKIATIESITKVMGDELVAMAAIVLKSDTNGVIVPKAKTKLEVNEDVQTNSKDKKKLSRSKVTKL